MQTHAYSITPRTSGAFDLVVTKKSTQTTKATILDFLRTCGTFRFWLSKHMYYTVIIVNFKGLTRMFLYIFILLTIFWIFEENRSLESLSNWWRGENWFFLVLRKSHVNTLTLTGAHVLVRCHKVWINPCLKIQRNNFRAIKQVTDASGGRKLKNPVENSQISSESVHFSMKKMCFPPEIWRFSKRSLILLSQQSL